MVPRPVVELFRELLSFDDLVGPGASHILNLQERDSCASDSNRIAGTKDGRSVSDSNKRTTPLRKRANILAFCVPDVDSVCAIHTIKEHLDCGARHYDGQMDFGEIQLSIQFVRGPHDVLDWIDKQREVAQQNPNVQFTPYLRVLLVGFGGNAMTDTHLYAAITDFFANRSLPPELRLEFMAGVLDFRRPLSNVVLSHDQWSVFVDEEEVVHLTSQNYVPPKGFHDAEPLAFLVSKGHFFFDTQASSALFCAAVACAWHLSNGRLDRSKYSDLLRDLERIYCSSYRSLQIDDNNSGLLPFLRNGCLLDALRTSDKLRFSELDVNEMRIRCGIECLQMANRFSALNPTLQEKVYEYLRSELNVPEQRSLNWLRHMQGEDDEMRAVASTDLSLLLDRILCCPARDSPDPSLGYCRNTVVALELLGKVMSAPLKDALEVSKQLFKLQQQAIDNNATLGKLLDLVRMSVMSRHLLAATVKQPAADFLHPTQLRKLAMLCSAKHARGVGSKRLPVLLSVEVSQLDTVFICALTPNADQHTPDPFPAILALAAKQHHSVTHDPYEPHIVRVFGIPAATDFRDAIASLFLKGDLSIGVEEVLQDLKNNDTDGVYPALSKTRSANKPSKKQGNPSLERDSDPDESGSQSEADSKASSERPDDLDD